LHPLRTLRLPPGPAPPSNEPSRVPTGVAGCRSPVSGGSDARRRGSVDDEQPGHVRASRDVCGASGARWSRRCGGRDATLRSARPRSAQRRTGRGARASSVSRSHALTVGSRSQKLSVSQLSLAAHVTRATVTRHSVTRQRARRRLASPRARRAARVRLRVRAQRGIPPYRICHNR
jgi:hypothetical protein